jgi:hypothetical protein
MAAVANKLTVIHQLAGALSPAELEQFKRERLRELQLAIDALRHEREARDPLLAWAIDQENGAGAPVLR